MNPNFIFCRVSAPSGGAIWRRQRKQLAHKRKPKAYSAYCSPHHIFTSAKLRDTTVLAATIPTTAGLYLDEIGRKTSAIATSKCDITSGPTTFIPGFKLNEAEIPNRNWENPLRLRGCGAGITETCCWPGLTCQRFDIKEEIGQHMIQTRDSWLNQVAWSYQRIDWDALMDFLWNMWKAKSYHFRWELIVFIQFFYEEWKREKAKEERRCTTKSEWDIFRGHILLKLCNWGSYMLSNLRHHHGLNTRLVLACQTIWAILSVSWSTKMTQVYFIAHLVMMLDFTQAIE